MTPVGAVPTEPLGADSSAVPASAPCCPPDVPAAPELPDAVAATGVGSLGDVAEPVDDAAASPDAIGSAAGAGVVTEPSDGSLPVPLGGVVTSSTGDGGWAAGCVTSSGGGGGVVPVMSEAPVPDEMSAGALAPIVP